MKAFLRNVLVNLICFWVISLILPAVDFSGKPEILLLASLALTATNIFIKPILNLLLLPLNLVTLGTFRWIINVIILFLVTMIIPDFKIRPFVFPGVAYKGFVIPQINVNLFWSFVIVSFVLSFVSNIIFSLFK